jgi:hypothetical protein
MARYTKTTASHSFLEAALVGLEVQKQKIEEQIAEVRTILGQRPAAGPKKAGAAPAAVAAAPAAAPAGRKRARRKLSEEARKRIAAAQKKRWAAFRKQTGKE